MADNIPIDNPGDSIPISNPSDSIPISNPRDNIPISNPSDSIPISNSYVPNPNPRVVDTGWNKPWTFDNWNRDFLRTPQSGSDPFTQDQVTSGLQQGNRYSDFVGGAISAGHDTPPPRPDLGSIYGDAPPGTSSYGQPSWSDIMGPAGPLNFSPADIPSEAYFGNQGKTPGARSELHVSDDDVANIVGGGIGAIERLGAMGLAGVIGSKVERLAQLANESKVGGMMESGDFFQGVLQRMQSQAQGAGVRGLVGTGVEDAIGFASEPTRGGQVIANATRGFLRAYGSRPARWTAGGVVGVGSLGIGSGNGR